MANRQDRRAAASAPKTVPRAVHDEVRGTLAALIRQQDALHKRHSELKQGHTVLSEAHAELSRTVERFRCMSTKERVRAAIRILRTGSID